MDPGPSNEFIVSQRHRSGVIWEEVGDIARCLRVRRCEAAMHRQMNLHSRMVPYLMQAGFYGVARVGFITFDWGLITAFVERWRPETHTFHLHSGECTITLQDVGIQLGLPIDGLPVTGRTDIDWADLCARSFGIRPGENDLRGSRLRLTWLRNAIPMFEDDADEIVVQQYCRAYILHLMGGCLFSDKSSAFVHLMFLPLLQDFDSIGRYSWGSACLGWLYRQLCLATDSSVVHIGGALILLQLWV